MPFGSMMKRRQRKSWKRSSMPQSPESPRLAINQSAEYIAGCFGLSKPQARRVKSMLASWSETCSRPGELLANVWEHRYLTLEEKAFATYVIASWTERLKQAVAVGATLCDIFGT